MLYNGQTNEYIVNLKHTRVFLVLQMMSKLYGQNS